MSLTLVGKPSATLKGTLCVPGDKSISHRSIILGAIAEGITTVSGFLNGKDCLATLNAFIAMGVNIQTQTDGSLLIHGVGKHGLKQPKTTIDLGNSGTSIRLLTGLLAGANVPAELSGDASLVKRPMNRVVMPLTRMGAKIDTAAGCAPLTIRAGYPLQGIVYDMPIASAQVKSCLLLAGLYASGRTTVVEPEISRDHTERMLLTFSYPIEKHGSQISIDNQSQLQGIHIDVPGDISSAAFFIVAASIAKQAVVNINNVGLNPTRMGIIHILNKMGANITLHHQRDSGAEPLADLTIRSASLTGIEIPPDQIPLAIDEFPAIFIAAACAKGKTILRGAKELRVKESDRIQAMAVGLQTLGISVETLEDGIIIEGGEMVGGEIDSFDDHRIAMSFAIAAVRAKGPITIRHCENIATSFPNFVQKSQLIGIDMQVI